MRFLRFNFYLSNVERVCSILRERLSHLDATIESIYSVKSFYTHLEGGENFIWCKYLCKLKDPPMVLAFKWTAASCNILMTDDI